MYENPYVGNQYMQQIPRYNGMQYQQMQQPVYQNPVQQAPTQQQAAVPQLIGRTVNSVDEITANGDLRQAVYIHLSPCSRRYSKQSNFPESFQRFRKRQRPHRMASDCYKFSRFQF